jgi:hypothetical protein
MTWTRVARDRDQWHDLVNTVVIYDIMIRYDICDIFINCSWVVTRWQYTFTHKQYTEQHK